VRKLTHKELVGRQQNQSSEKLPFTAVLNNIRSLYNVGSIFRTADGIGIEKLWLCGITGTPESERERIEKTALGAEKTVPWEHRSETLPLLRELRQNGYQVVLLEQTHQSVPYQEFIPRFPVCLVLGNEINGVSDEHLSLCDAAIEIEMAGLKNSLNVTVAFGIIAYHLRNCLRLSLRANEVSEAISEIASALHGPLPRNDGKGQSR